METCAECGREVHGGTAGCRADFDALVARDFSNVLFGRWHRLLVDVYALQHPETFCISAKSFAAHLGGLCCWMERGGDAETYRALQRSLNGPSQRVKPELPHVRGAQTLASVLGMDDPKAYGESVERWAADVWAAYAALHATARTYLDT